MKLTPKALWLFAFASISVLSLVITHGEDATTPTSPASSNTPAGNEKWETIKKNNDDMLQSLTQIEQDLNFARLRITQSRVRPKPP